MDPGRNVNVVIAIDAEAVLAAYPGGGGDLASPIELPGAAASRYIAMLTRDPDLRPDAASAGANDAGVQIAAAAGTRIRLFVRSLQPIEYAVVLRRCDLCSAAAECRAAAIDVIGMAPGRQPTEDHLEIHREALHWWEVATTEAGDAGCCRCVVQIWSTGAAEDGALTDRGCFSWDAAIRAMPSTA